MVRRLRFHVFERFAKAWPDVYPGDVVISPETIFYTYDEKENSVITAKKPMLVLSRLDGIDHTGATLANHASTFIVYSISMGFLVTVMNRFEEDGQLGT